ncbi:MAG TPA: PAS domain S-box protein [Methylomirabilota bacterium]|nr:PAS domain S-box protein [Methylomirabilota bacterium]
MRLADLSIRRKVTVAILTACVLAVGLATIDAIVLEWRNLRARAPAELQALTEIIAASIYRAVELDDVPSAAETLGGLRGAPYVSSAHLYRTNGVLVAQYVRPDTAGHPIPAPPEMDGTFLTREGLVLTRTLVRNGQPFARLRLVSDLSSIRAEMLRSMFVILAVAVVLLAAAFWLASLLQRAIAGPLEALAGTARAVTERKDYSLRAPVHGRDEIAELATGFNQMLAAIQTNEAALRASEHLLSNIISNTPSAISVKDLEGRYLLANERHASLFGHTLAEVKLRTDFDLCPRPVAERRRATDTDVIATGGPVELEEIIPQPDGHHVFLCAKFPLRDAAHNIYAVGCIATDITDLKRAEEALRRSRAHLEAAQAQARVGSWEYDPVEGTGMWTREMYRVLARAPELGPPTFEGFVELFHPEDRPRLRQACAVRQPQAEPVILDLRSDPALGPLRHFQCNVYAVGGREGRFSHLAGTLQDISDRVRVAETVARENAFRESIIASAAEGICVAERLPEAPWIRFRVWNTQMVTITGYDMDDANRQGWLELMAPDEEVRARMRKRMEQVFAGENALAEEWRLKRADGAVRHVLVSTCLLSSPDGPPQVLGVFHDITERKQAEEEVRQLNAALEQRVAERTEELARRVTEVEQLNRGMINMLEDLQEARAAAETAASRLSLANSNLQAANKELESFSYSVSHDLRSPLRHIAGFTALPSVAGDAQARRFAQVIADSARRMGLLIDDLLAFSRMSRSALHLAPVDLNVLVTDVRRELELDLTGRRVNWKIEPLPCVNADASLLRQVFLNLLGNALKYSRSRAESVIEIGGRTSDREITVFVRDNGVGFNMKYADKLFGVFQRLHRDDEFEGTGIGLAIVQRIVHRHGGQVWAESAPNEGATFYFTLPARTSALEQMHLSP